MLAALGESSVDVVGQRGRAKLRRHAACAALRLRGHLWPTAGDAPHAHAVPACPVQPTAGPRLSNLRFDMALILAATLRTTSGIRCFACPVQVLTRYCPCPLQPTVKHDHEYPPRGRQPGLRGPSPTVPRLPAGRSGRRARTDGRRPAGRGPRAGSAPSPGEPTGRLNACPNSRCAPSRSS